MVWIGHFVMFGLPRVVFSVAALALVPFGFR